MKRYYKEVKKLDDEKMMVEDFIIAVCGEDEFNDPKWRWMACWTSARIYLEDGGRKYTVDDFLKLAKEPDEVKGKFNEWMRR